jgi:hypothetical protein
LILSAAFSNFRSFSAKGGSSMLVSFRPAQAASRKAARSAAGRANAS